MGDSSFLGQSLVGKWALEGGGLLGPVHAVSRWAPGEGR